MNNVNFARNLVKGKIAETIFAQMLRETNQFTVLEFGYEKLVPELVMQGYNENYGLVETLRSAPDFAVINKTKKEVRLIEVKYMHHLSHEFALKAAIRMHASWNPSYLFIATLDGFYFGAIEKIMANNGNVAPLKHPFISQEIQEKYLRILCDFEANN
ncbi:hypothetical protein FJZ39_01545 [Candidatus Saccharibacteria bacterium]|nr:hypothetical protein [Candidatus Saccharibacteria bacterium]